MSQKKRNIAILLGDPSGIGPELISKLMTQPEINYANIILIGDQNQLGQPIRGTHPNESGQSILDYLLEGKDTISEDRGIFLNKTYRLNSKLNEFISSNFYEERLICDKSTDKRIINFNKNF